jgi:hypothetical protein
LAGDFLPKCALEAIAIDVSVKAQLDWVEDVLLYLCRGDTTSIPIYAITNMIDKVFIRNEPEFVLAHDSPNSFDW